MCMCVPAHDSIRCGVVWCGVVWCECRSSGVAASFNEFLARTGRIAKRDAQYHSEQLMAQQMADKQAGVLIREELDLIKSAARLNAFDDDNDRELTRKAVKTFVQEYEVRHTQLKTKCCGGERPVSCDRMSSTTH
jgi:hypothetical protein